MGAEGKSTSWKQKGLGLITLAGGLLFALVAGLFLYIGATSKPLHPNPQEVPSVAHLTPPQKWADAVGRGRQIVRASVAEQNLPGASVAVGVGGDIVWAEGFGWAHLANRAPVTPEMRFRIGTASQVLTSAAVGLLLEKGALGLDDEIQMHVPAFPNKQWPVTLRQLMGHVAGIRNDEEGEEPVSVPDDDPQSVRCQGPGDGLERFADGALQFEPETQFRSSSYGWILVSAAVEEAADEPFSTFMRKKIFEPLGMSDTMADSPREPGPDRMPFYFPRFSADPKYGPDEGRDVDYSCFSGSAAFLSTASDLVRFGMAINSGKLLRPATVQLLQAPQRLTSGQDTGYGLGWDLETVELMGEQTRLAGHDGELMGGMVASLITFPSHGIVVSVTTNIAFADTYSVAVKIAQAFAKQEKSPAAR